MPISTTRIVKAVQADMENKGFKFDELSFSKDFIESVVSQIVIELQTNALITVPSVSGVTTGAGVSGPGTGTIS